MTYLNQAHALQNTQAPHHGVATLFRNLRDHLRLKRRQKKLDDLPNHLLRDVGLEHLRDRPAEPSFHRRFL